MTDPTIAPLRVHLGAEGLVISGSKMVVDEFGVAYIFTELKGWDEPPAVVTTIKKRAGAHGSTAGASYQGERNIVIPGYVIVPSQDPAALRAAVDRLFAAIPLDDELLVVHEYGTVRHLKVRQGGAPTGDRVGRKEGKHRIAAFNIQLVALDPIRLSGDGTGPTKSLATAPGATGSVTVPTGDGLVPPITLRFGPCTDPKVSIDGIPGELWYSLTIPDGQELTVNLETKSAKLNGVSVNGSMRGSWLKPARKSNTFTYSAATYGTGGLTVDTYDSSP